MQIERTAPWLLTFEYTIANIVGAEAWQIELKDLSERRGLVLAKRGDPVVLLPDVHDQLADLAGKIDVERRAFRWIDLDRDDADAAAGTSAFIFACALPTRTILTGVMTLDRDALNDSAFQGETEFLKFIEGLASSVARERRVVEDKWVMQRLLASMAIQCVVVNSAGRVVVNTMKAPTGADAKNSNRGRVAAPMQGLINQVMSQYRSAPRTRSSPYHVSKVDLGSGDSKPLYVVPLTKENVEARPDFFALLLPRRSEPPCDATLAAALSLTPAEAKVVRQMMFGRKTREIAEQVSLTEQTVRTYLKRIYAKLGVSGQSELIAKVNELSVPLAAASRSSPETVLPT